MNVAETMTYRGKLLIDEPMSKHTSWRVGGKADRYYRPADLADLQSYLAGVAQDVPITWVGLGSNMLVRDGGIRGEVIAALGGLKDIQLRKDGCVYAESGITSGKLARFCQKHDFDGADFLAGIPGTVGGALTMNAGAFGSETWNHVERVTMINRRGELVNRMASEFSVAYRKVSQFPDEWFAAGYFRFKAKTGNQESNIKQLLKKRNDSQPIGLPSCGSVFKNPAGHHAAKLIESAGLKGHKIGDACVSDKDANFIISTENTRAADIEALIGFIQKTVKQKFDVDLETEVRILGEAL
jgi:UDP-N-acetylmuramate dehydrogenase